MWELSDAFQERAKRQQAEFDAVQDEIAGRGLNRQSKLGRMREELETRRSGRAGGSLAQYASQLDYLLARDPDYRAAYVAATEALTTADAEAEREIARFEQALQNAQLELDTLVERAATLPDGTKVFRAADGTFYDQDGNDVTHLADHIEWRGYEPSWEEYTRQRGRVEELTAQLLAWRQYQVDVLVPAREALENRNKPPSRKELEEITRDIEAKAPKSLEEIQATPELETTSVSNVAIPSLG